jgi:TP901 family phage tail tape measure protein
LEVELRLAADSFSNGIRAAQRDAKDLEKELRPLKETTFAIASTMAAVGGTVIGAMGAMAVKTADFGDALNDARQRTGISAETLSKLAYAAELSGTSIDGVSTGVKFLAKNMEAAITKGGEQRAAFQSLGISTKQLEAAHGDVNKIMLMVADRFEELPDGAEKSAVAMRVFGKSGTELIPLLNAGAEGIRAMGDEGTRVGRVMTDEAAKAADEFNDKLKSLTGATQGVGMAIGNALIPTLTKLFELGTNVVVVIKDWVAAHPDLTRAVGALAVVITGAGGLLLGISGVIAILPALTVGFAVLTGPVGIAVAAVVGLGAAFAAFPAFRGVVLDVIDRVVTALGFLGSYLKSVGTAVFDLVMGKPGEAMKVMGSAYSSAMETAADASAGLHKGLQALTVELPKVGKATKETTDTSAALMRQQQKNSEELKRQADAWRALQDSLSRIPIGGYTSDWERLSSRIDGTKTKVELLRDALISVPPAAEQASIGVENIDFAAAAASGGLGALNQEVAALLAKPPAVSVKFGPDQAEIAADKARLETATASIRDSAGKIFDDLLIKGENVFSSLGNALMGGALSLGRSIFQDVTASLLGPIKLAFDDFFTGLLQSTGIKSFLNGIGEKLGGVLGGVFGGGAEAASSVAGSIGSAGSAGGSIGSSIGGATSLTGSLISAAGGVLGGVISALGSARMEGTLNAIEANTRFTYIEIFDLMNGHLNAIINYQKITTEQLGYDGVTGWLRDIAGFFAGMPRYAEGTSYVPYTGPAILHQGEQVIPAGDSRGTVINLNIENLYGSDAKRFAREVLDEINDMVKYGSRTLYASAVTR